MDADAEHDQLDWGDVAADDAAMREDDAISLGSADEDDFAALQKYQALPAQGDPAPADPAPAPAAPAAPAPEPKPTGAAVASAPDTVAQLPQTSSRPDPRPQRRDDRERDWDRDYRDSGSRRARPSGSPPSGSSTSRPLPPRSRPQLKQLPTGGLPLPPKPPAPVYDHPYAYPENGSHIEASVMAATQRARDRDRDHPPPAGRRIPREELVGLGPDWEIHTSSSGADFFYNNRTQATQWDRPRLTPPPPPPPPPPRGPPNARPPRQDSYAAPARHDNPADYHQSRRGSDPDGRHYASHPEPEPSSSSWPAHGPARRDYPQGPPPTADDRMLRRGGSHYSPEQTRGRRELPQQPPRPQSPPLPRRRSPTPPRYEVKRGTNSWRPEDDQPRVVGSKWQNDHNQPPAGRDRERERERGREPERGRAQQDQNGGSNRNRRGPRARSVENNGNGNTNASAPRAPAVVDVPAPRPRSPPASLPSPSVPTLTSTSSTMTTSPPNPPSPIHEPAPVKETNKRPREDDNVRSKTPPPAPAPAPVARVEQAGNAKRQRTNSDPDSTRSRRTPPDQNVAFEDTKDSPRKRKPLPPQGELFQAKRVLPPSPEKFRDRDAGPPPSYRGNGNANGERVHNGSRGEREYRPRRDSVSRNDQHPPHPPPPPPPQRSPAFHANGRSPLPPPGLPLHVDTAGPRQSRFGPPQGPPSHSPPGSAEWGTQRLPPPGRQPRTNGSPLENGRHLHPERRGRQPRFGASPLDGPPPLPNPGPIPVASQQGFYKNAPPPPARSPVLDRNQMPLPPSQQYGSLPQGRPSLLGRVSSGEFAMREQGPPPPRGGENNWQDRDRERQRPPRHERGGSFRNEGPYRSRSASPPRRSYAPPPPPPPPLEGVMQPSWAHGPPPPPLINGMHPERVARVVSSRQPPFYQGPPRQDTLGLDVRGMQPRKAPLIERISDASVVWDSENDVRADDNRPPTGGRAGDDLRPPRAPGGGGRTSRRSGQRRR
ncbi:hypothetical protein AURDEDRAFT_114718 [Auricularia subglabra TFB-10046 SS5]|nr:hypothetical protein AURDEDRAFT_114718 [Auricularia subglabra TFB-10046 SS5]